MGLINAKASSKKFYTQDEDKQIIKLINEEKKSISAIAEATGRSEASLRYRVKVLDKANSFDDIHYKA
jgi:DNA-binding Lrp family transcriptional regulator